MEIEAEVAHDSSEKITARRIFHCLCERSVNVGYPGVLLYPIRWWNSCLSDLSVLKNLDSLQQLATVELQIMNKQVRLAWLEIYF